MNGLLPPLAPTAVVALGASGVYYTIRLLDGPTLRQSLRQDAGKITLVCYLFSLSAWLTAMIGAWLTCSGQVAADGQPASAAATLAFWLADEVLVIQRELLVVAALVSIVVVPQLLNYLVAGLFGAAGTTRFGAWCLRFVFWTAIKGFAVAGGVSLVWGLFAWALNWPHVHDTGPYDLIGNGMAGMALAAFFAAVAGPLEDDVTTKLRSGLRPLAERLMPLHRWFTRHRLPQAD